MLIKPVQRRLPDDGHFLGLDLPIGFQAQELNSTRQSLDIQSALMTPFLNRSLNRSKLSSHHVVEP